MGGIRMKIEFLFLNEIDSQYLDDVWNLLCMNDHEFVPPLSSRESTTQSILSDRCDGSFPYSYFEKLKKQNIILAMCSDQMVGFMSYIEHYHHMTIGETVYISTVIVGEKYRGNSITEEMYNQLCLTYPEKHIMTRTWSTNYAHIHILNKLGFNILDQIKNDRGEGIDTIYFIK